MRTPTSEVYARGGTALGEILKALHVDLQKAPLDPLDDGDYRRIVGRLSGALRRATEGTEARALRAALNRLDVDWRGMSESARDRVVAAARRALPDPARVAALTQPVWQGARDLPERAFQSAARKIAPGRRIDFDPRLSDIDIPGYMTESQALYVTNHLGDVNELWAAKARETVARGVNAGLGRRAIAETLERRVGPAAVLGRRRAYWDVIASAFANRSRQFGHLTAFREAGMGKYVIEAVLDEVTTDICRYLHGREFSVQRALQRYADAAAAEDPTDVKQLMPWVRSSKGELWIPGEGDSRSTIATVERSAVGRRDAIGTYTGKMSDAELEANGVLVPPFHGRCRTTIVEAG